MIRLSRAARAQVFALATHYDRHDRTGAIRNLRRAISRAAIRISCAQGAFYPAPRPYPLLTRAGWYWLKEGPYWIAFVSSEDGHVIQVVFHEAADIPRRL